MKRSPETVADPSALPPLPPTLSSMWRLCKLGYRFEPRLMVVTFGLSQLSALPDALLALWLMLLGKGYLEHRPAYLQVAAVGLGGLGRLSSVLVSLLSRSDSKLSEPETRSLSERPAEPSKLTRASPIVSPLADTCAVGLELWCFLVMRLMTPPEPAALNAAEGFVITSTRSNWFAGKPRTEIARPGP